jgi:hypothetical protein
MLVSHGIEILSAVVSATSAYQKHTVTSDILILQTNGKCGVLEFTLSKGRHVTMQPSIMDQNTPNAAEIPVLTILLSCSHPPEPVFSAYKHSHPNYNPIAPSSQPPT